MPNSLKSRLKNLVRNGLLRERDLKRIIIIPEGATNEDVLKKTFSDMVCYIGEGEEKHMCFGFEMLSDEWVKAPYQIDREVEE